MQIVSSCAGHLPVQTYINMFGYLCINLEKDCNLTLLRTPNFTQKIYWCKLSASLKSFEIWKYHKNPRPQLNHNQRKHYRLKSASKCLQVERNSEKGKEITHNLIETRINHIKNYLKLPKYLGFLFQIVIANRKHQKLWVGRE